MAQGVTIAGNSYPGVPSIEVPKTGGGTAVFYDASIATATADKIESGYTAFGATGLITGTGSGGGGGSDISTETYYGDNYIDFDGNVPTFMYTSGSSIIMSQIFVSGADLPDALSEVSFTMSYYDEDNSVGYFSCGDGDASDFPTGSYIITLSATEQSDVFEILVYNCDDWSVSSPEESELIIYTIAPSGGGSGGVSLPVIGGTTRPASPAANTIWVNTSTAIGNWYVQNTAPTSPSTGDVWITLKPSLTNLINLSDSGSFMVGFGRTQQYVSGAWLDKDAELYDGNSWMKLQTYVYNLGDLCSETTGGWSIFTSGSNSLNAFASDHLAHDYKSSSANLGFFVTDQAIDLTEYTEIHLDYEVTSGSTGTAYHSGLYLATNNTNYNNINNNKTVLSEWHVSSRARQTITVDITNFSGSFYIATLCQYSKWNAYRIWLTK